MSNSPEQPNAQSLVDSLASVLEPRMKRIAQDVVEEQADLQAFSIPEVMKRLDASEYVVRKMIAEGTLEAVRPTEGTVRITARSVRKFLYGDKVSGVLPPQSQET
ncbi:MAG: helix-turn-helix domain-containing protein [Acidobacteriota bacterium]|nr:helix-turn-helix domain-containing protein [Acidobacteriota bacterium]